MSILKGVREAYWQLFTRLHPALQILCRTPGIESLLDVWCGRGMPIKALQIRCKIGVDVDPICLRMCLKEKIHSYVVLSDAAHLPFHDKSFDGMLCLQVLHTLRKADALLAIDGMERVARKCIILVIPVGSPRIFVPRTSWR
jgi:ubiquinone/menaquinone biosynthesis C-methylase UbiE